MPILSNVVNIHMFIVYTLLLLLLSLPLSLLFLSSLLSIIAITLLHIWSAHWLFVFQERRFWPNGIAAKAVLHIHKVQAEYQQKLRSAR